MTYPDGEVLTYHYDTGGQVDRPPASRATFTYHVPAAAGLRQVRAAGAARTPATAPGPRTPTTPPTGGWPTCRPSCPTGTSFQNLGYSYDDVGNVTSIEQRRPSRRPGPGGSRSAGRARRPSRYDDLYRLTHAEGSYQPRTPHEPTATGCDMTYDTIHNITQQDPGARARQHQRQRTASRARRTYNYDYAYAGAQPHAPTHDRASTRVALRRQRQPDQPRRSSPRPRRQMVWDEENRLACTHENVQSHTLPQTPASCDNAGGTPTTRATSTTTRATASSRTAPPVPHLPEPELLDPAATRRSSTSSSATTQADHEDRRARPPLRGPPVLLPHRPPRLDRLRHRRPRAACPSTCSTSPAVRPGSASTRRSPCRTSSPARSSTRRPGCTTTAPATTTREPSVWQTPDPALGSYLDGAPNGGVYHPGQPGAVHATPTTTRSG